ncbi:MAG: hypothetical protein ABIR37_01215 [Candidatus Saccharimonadales bacterium]
MTKFCEQCPMSPRTNQDIEFGCVSGIKETARAFMGQGPVTRSGVMLVGMVADKLGNSSWPIRVPEDFTPENVMDYFKSKITFCDGPTTKIEGLFRKREVIDACPVLGAFAVRYEVGILARRHFTQEVASLLLDEEMHATIAPPIEENAHKRAVD